MAERFCWLASIALILLQIQITDGSRFRRDATRRVCFTCQSTDNLTSCNKLVECNLGEVCFLHKFVENNGHTTYEAGCVSSNSKSCPNLVIRRNVDSDGRKESIRQIDRSRRNPSCRECCDSDGCNYRGCGQSVFPISSGGPRCFNCHNFGNVSECTSFSQCDTTESCSIEAYRWGDNELNYMMGCKHKTVCMLGARRYAPPTNKRSLPVCHACCDGNFCNRNCTQGSHGALFG